MSRATANRKARPAVADPTPREKVVPANKLSPSERAQVLEVLDSEEFVDQPPLQV